MRIHLEQFAGIAPKISSALLPPQMAVAAGNCRFGSGALAPWNGTESVASLAKSGTIRSLYRYAGQFWFHWLQDVDLVQAPVALDAYGRVYWSGEDYPRVGGSDVVTSGGGSAYPTNSYRLGVPAPGSAPSVVVSGSPSDELPAVSRSYVFTYQDCYGAEGPPSDPSGEVEVANGQLATVALPNDSLSGSNITLKNVYRRVTGSDDGEWMLVGSVPLATTSFEDSASAADLNTVLPSLLWDGPPDDLRGLVEHPMGSLAGFSGKELILSERYRPHAWPYRYAVSNPIVAIGVYGTYILVTTTGLPVLFFGDDPASMNRDRLEKGEACVSKRGMVDMGTACIYPGPSGLWGVGVGEASNLTEKIMTLEQWRGYAPETLLGAQYDGSYLGFYDNGVKQAGFVFNPSSGDFGEIDLYATAAWHDPESGRLYLVVDGAVVEWNGGDPLTLTWRSRPYYASGPVNLACAKVLAQGYPVTLKVYADGVLTHTQTVVDEGAFRLPDGFRALKWQAEVTGTQTVNSVTLAGSIRELQGEG